MQPDPTGQGLKLSAMEKTVLILTEADKFLHLVKVLLPSDVGAPATEITGITTAFNLLDSACSQLCTSGVGSIRKIMAQHLVSSLISAELWKKSYLDRAFEPKKRWGCDVANEVFQQLKITVRLTLPDTDLANSFEFEIKKAILSTGFVVLQHALCEYKFSNEGIELIKQEQQELLDQLGWKPEELTSTFLDEVGKADMSAVETLAGDKDRLEQYLYTHLLEWSQLFAKSILEYYQIPTKTLRERLLKSLDGSAI